MYNISNNGLISYIILYINYFLTSECCSGYYIIRELIKGHNPVFKIDIRNIPPFVLLELLKLCFTYFDCSVKLYSQINTKPRQYIADQYVYVAWLNFWNIKHEFEFNQSSKGEDILAAISFSFLVHHLLTLECTVSQMHILHV